MLLIPMFSVSAETVSTVTFERNKMEFYNPTLAHWFIREETTADEYLCCMSVSQLAPNETYASYKSYSVQSDCDFWFNGFIQATVPSWITAEEGEGTTMDFFACTEDGTIIYPTDGSAKKTLTVEDGAVKVDFGVAGLSEGDTIYFVTMTDMTYKAPYLTFVGTLFESPYGTPVAQRVAYTDTNEFYDVQDKEGWGYGYTPKASVQFSTKEVTTTAPVTTTTTVPATTTTVTGDTTDTTTSATAGTTGTSDTTTTASTTAPSDVEAGGDETDGGMGWLIGLIIAVVVVAAGVAVYFLVIRKRSSDPSGE